MFGLSRTVPFSRSNDAPRLIKARRPKFFAGLMILEGCLLLLCAVTLTVKVLQAYRTPAAPRSMPSPITAQPPAPSAQPAAPRLTMPPVSAQPLKFEQAASRVRIKPARPRQARPPISPLPSEAGAGRTDFLTAGAAQPAAAQPAAAKAQERNRRLIIEWKKGQEPAANAETAAARNRRLIIEWQRLQQAAPEQAPGPSAAAGQERRSVPVEFEVEAPRARSVQLAGAFIVHGGRRQMVQQDQGAWALTLRLLPGVKYRYWFVVDGKKKLDPRNPKTERMASVLSLP